MQASHLNAIDEYYTYAKQHLSSQRTTSQYIQIMVFLLRSGWEIFRETTAGPPGRTVYEENFPNFLMDHLGIKQRYFLRFLDLGVTWCLAAPTFGDVNFCTMVSKNHSAAFPTVKRKWPPFAHNKLRAESRTRNFPKQREKSWKPLN